MSNRQLGKDWELTTMVNSGPIIVGGTPSDLLTELIAEALDSMDIDPEKEEINRNYLLGPGLMSKLEAVIEHPKWGAFRNRFYYYNLFITSGPSGNDQIYIYNSRYDLPVWKGVRLGLEFTYFYRDTDYKDYPDFIEVVRRGHVFRTLLAYRF